MGRLQEAKSAGIRASSILWVKPVNRNSCDKYRSPQ
jgi:hypothetical protein